MRLGLKLISGESTLNRISYLDQLKMVRGERPTLMFQLVDLDQNGLRYIPSSNGTIVTVALPRLPTYVPDVNNTRQTMDYSINRPASQSFSQDGSIWSIQFTDAESAAMISNSLRVTVDETASGGTLKIANLQQAIKVIGQ